MESSDEEGEIVADCVTNYYLVNGKNEMISFSRLPLRWDDQEEGEGHGEGEQKLVAAEHAFLRGMTEDGCGVIFRKVIAWKFVLSYVTPEIYVLQDVTKNERWIKLHRPRNCYENTIKTVLISVHYLHFIKRNLDEASMDEIWKHIREIFSTYDVPPSDNDLVDQLELIKEAARRDKDIAKAKNLHTFLSQISGKRKAFCEENNVGKKPKFIVYEDDAGIVDDDDDDLSGADKDELFDNVCAFCDDGGELLGCEGRCIRSFHPTIESGADSSCESLCYSQEQVDALQTFLCKNCKYQLHQCFICGRLGSSDKSSGAEVFPCVSATCGHFYHPQCLSELIFPKDEKQAQEYQKNIKAGNSFTCPAHKCIVCKQEEDKNIPELQFAVCRRCPKAYHSKCLPREFSFYRNDAENIIQRAWTNLLTKRILIYCMDHKIFRKILTPRRDHLLIPNDDGKKEPHPGKLSVMSARRSKIFGILTNEEKVGKLSKGISGDFQSGESINKNEKNFTVKVSKLNVNSSTTVPKNSDISNWSGQKKPSLIKLSHISDKPISTPSMKRIPEKAAAENIPTGSAATLRKAEMRNRIERLMENSTSSLNVEEFLAKQREKCTYISSLRLQVEKTITQGKVERSVQAIQAALEKLLSEGTIKDAKAVCEPAVLTQMIKWKKKLSVYLAPFIHGMRYTSFGRHFTSVDKLKQVVNQLRWYVQDGDTIVDFSCGSNDFSLLMKEALDRMGIKCSFKNYDLIQSKSDFNFERRDWFSVGLEELPEGSNLIMGLNPPFGVQAFLANQFIDKALSFGPKLLVLIVPKETERLDRKKTPYDLIWEDDHILSGKSFYLPGSVDVNEQQIEQWNKDPPPLYLWSRPDWTMKHKQIAMDQGHLIRNQDMECAPNYNYLMQENQDCFGDFSSIADGYVDINSILEDVPDVASDDN